MQIGDIVTVVTDNCRLPKGTQCEIMTYSKTTDQYYIRNVDSEYCCWAKKDDIYRIQKEVIDDSQSR